MLIAFAKIWRKIAGSVFYNSAKIIEYFHNLVFVINPLIHKIQIDIAFKLEFIATIPL